MMRNLVALLIPIAVGGCASSSYHPADSPRVAMVVDDGWTLYKSGKAYPAGEALGGIEEAVRGNPRAEREARAAHHLGVAGLILEYAGLGSSVSGVVVAATSDDNRTRGAVGAGLILGGLVLEVAAIVLYSNAVPHMYDAVNIYNDGLPSAPARGQAPSIETVGVPPAVTP